MSLNCTINNVLVYHFHIILQMYVVFIKCISCVIFSQSVIDSIATMLTIKFFFLLFHIQKYIICVSGKVCVCNKEDVLFTNQCEVYKMEKCKSCSPLDCLITQIT